MTSLYAPCLDRDDYRQEAALAALTGRNVQRHLIDVTRKWTHHRRAEPLTFCELGEYHGMSGDTTSDQALARIEARRVLAAVGPRAARCLVRQTAGERQREIAAAEGITVGAVEGLLARARRAVGTL